MTFTAYLFCALPHDQECGKAQIVRGRRRDRRKFERCTLFLSSPFGSRSSQCMIGELYRTVIQIDGSSCIVVDQSLFLDCSYYPHIFLSNFFYIPAACHVIIPCMSICTLYSLAPVVLALLSGIDK
jgi:hypothetical protein